jgi:repressor LexA
MKTEIIGRNIKLKRLAANITQVDLAEKLGVSQAYIHKIESGTESLKVTTVEKIAGALGLDISELIFKAHPFPYRHIPIRGVVNAGEPMITFDDLTDYETVAFDTERGDFFALKVQGHSMDKVAPDGSTIIIDPKQTDPQALHKQAIVAIQDGEVLFKMWDNSLKLFQPKSTRDDYDPIPAKYGAQILGKVVAFIVRC